MNVAVNGPFTWAYTANYRTYARMVIAATVPVCRCGARSMGQDCRWRWRCARGHFARPGSLYPL